MTPLQQPRRPDRRRPGGHTPRPARIPGFALTVLTLAGLGASPTPAAGQQLTLAETVRAALEGHPTVRAARARLSGAHADVATAQAARRPQLAFDASALQFQEPMVVAPLHGFDPSQPPTFDRSLVQGRLGVRQLLFDAGTTAADRRARTALASRAEVEVARTESELIEQVVGAFLTVRTTRAVREAAAARLEALRAEVSRAEQALSAGTVAEVEALTAAAALADAEASAGSARARVELAERALARIATLPLERVEGPLTDPVPETFTLVALSSSGAVDDAPTVVGARQGLTAANARLDGARGARLVRLEAEGALVDYGTLAGAHTMEWQAGLRLSVPLFAGGGHGARIRAADAEAEAARAELDAARLAVRDEVDRARTTMIEAEARRVALGVAVVRWAEVARIEQLALDAGSGVQRDLLEAQAGLFEASAGLAGAAADAVLGRVRLARIAGVLDVEWIDRTEEEGR